MRRSYKDCVMNIVHRPTKFGVRENTALSRKHASPHVAVISNVIYTGENNLNVPGAAPIHNRPAAGFEGSLHSAPQQAATGGERMDENHLLTVREVAELLQVPLSWVYEQTRLRTIDRIPGFRLGKYWRFNAADVRAWIRERRTNHYHHD